MTIICSSAQKLPIKVVKQTYSTLFSKIELMAEIVMLQAVKTWEK